MLFTGNYRRSLDKKLRIALPKPIREQIAGESADGLYLAPGLDHALDLYTSETMERLHRQIASRSPLSVEQRNFDRLFYSRIQTLEIDSQGRIRIDQHLSDWANLGEEVIFVGVRDHFEVWDGGQWDAFAEANQSNFDQLARRALVGLELSISSNHSDQEHSDPEHFDPEHGSADSIASVSHRPR